MKLIFPFSKYFFKNKLHSEINETAAMTHAQNRADHSESEAQAAFYPPRNFSAASRRPGRVRPERRRPPPRSAAREARLPRGGGFKTRSWCLASVFALVADSVGSQGMEEREGRTAPGGDATTARLGHLGAAASRTRLRDRLRASALRLSQLLTSSNWCLDDAEPGRSEASLNGRLHRACWPGFALRLPSVGSECKPLHLLGPAACWVVARLEGAVRREPARRACGRGETGQLLAGPGGEAGQLLAGPHAEPTRRCRIGACLQALPFG